MEDLHCGNMTKDHEQQPKQLYTPYILKLPVPLLKIQMI